MNPLFVMLFTVISITVAQRASYAGLSPIGYPSYETTTANAALGNRFGDNDTPTTTVRLPIEAQGNADFVASLRKLPMDQQPFWLLNWAALEAYRNNPQTYTQRRNTFIDNGVQGN